MSDTIPTYLIKNARLVHEGRSYEADVLLSGGRIERIDDSISPKNNSIQIIDGGGKLLIPGVIDTQVHFREPGLTHKADLTTESMAAVAGGVTSYVEQPNTVPAATTLELLEAKFARAAEVSWANYSFSLGASNTNLEELKRASKRDVAAIKMFLGSSTGDLLVDDPTSVERIFREVDHQLIAHCEDEPTMRANLERLIEERGGREHLTAADHPLIRSEEACYLSSSRAVALARETGAHFHVYHVSTAKELDLFDGEIPLTEKKITAEACVHHLWFSDADYAELGNRIKWNPAVKTTADRDALRAQQLKAMAGMGRIRIAGAHDHGAETGGQDGVHARRRAPVRAARLQRDVQDGVRGGLTAQGAQGHDLGMRLAGLGVEAFGDDPAAFGDDRPHHRVRVRASPSLTGELEGSPHRRLGSGHGHGQRLRLRETAAALALPGVSCGSE